MAARTAEATGLWLAGISGLCTCGVMVANGLDDGWNGIEIMVASLAVAVVVSVAILLVRLYSSRGRNVPGRPDREQRPSRP